VILKEMKEKGDSENRKKERVDLLHQRTAVRLYFIDWRSSQGEKGMPYMSTGGLKFIPQGKRPGEGVHFHGKRRVN